MDRNQLSGEARANLEEVVRLYGIQPAYRNSRGETTRASVEALVRVLQSMDAPVRGVGDIAEARRHRRSVLAQQIVEPVVVVWAGSAGLLQLRLRPDERDRPLDFRLQTEGGQVHEWRVDPRTLEITAGEGWSRGLLIHAMGLVAHVPGELPLGLHAMTVATRTRGATTRVIVAPPTAWAPEGETPGWGVFLPMHALRTRRSWGTADFRDMASLLSWTAAMGGRAVGTLPLLATFLDTPFDPSPYAPVSRLFWNELYLDVERAPEFHRSEAAKSLLASDAVQRRIRELRDAPRVDYRNAAALKRPILEALAQTSLREGPSSDFRTFLEERPEVERYARFRATVEQRKAGWRTWPTGLRDSELAESDDDFDARVEHFHLYVQWLADRQLTALAEDGRSVGAELYLDLPLGAHPDGFDAWRFRDQFAEGVSGGAPPDAFFRGGQDWGFPPLHPMRTRAAGHEYTVASVRTLMRFAGTLRLDHVMSLHRLFWVPQGLGASEGVYVRYPAEELYAILCLESRRHRTVLVGEDLGTVPEEVRVSMASHDLRRMYVVPFELSTPGFSEAPGERSPDERPAAAPAASSAPEPDDAAAMGPEFGDPAVMEEGADGEPSVGKRTDAALAPVPALSVASLNTHDMPTFAGFWTGQDIRTRVAAGMLPEEDAPEEERARDAFRRTLADELVRRGAMERPGEKAEEATEDVMARRVLRALLRVLAGSQARLLLVNLEDLWLEREPQNVPGTPGEENWRNKSAHELEALLDLPEVVEALNEVDRIRKAVAAEETGEGVGRATGGEGGRGDSAANDPAATDAAADAEWIADGAPPPGADEASRVASAERRGENG